MALDGLGSSRGTSLLGSMGRVIGRCRGSITCLLLSVEMGCICIEVLELLVGELLVDFLHEQRLCKCRLPTHGEDQSEAQQHRVSPVVGDSTVARLAETVGEEGFIREERWWR